MNNTIILSICIATYNRENYIGETLDSIFSQNTDQIEVIVVDGGSTDGTANAMIAYQEKYLNFRYIKLPNKGGFDEDYSFTISCAKGIYCWLFSDDDIIKPRAINYILNQIKLNYDVIIVNAEILNKNLSKVLKNKCINLKSNLVFKSINFEDFFITTAPHSSFVGSIVIKRSIWDARDKRKYFGTMFVHVGVLFQSCYDGDLLVIADPLVSIRYGNAMWTARSFEISFLIWPKLIWDLNNFSYYAKNIVCSKNKWKRIRRLFFYRATGSYSQSHHTKFLVGTLDLIGITLSYLIAITPGRLLNFILYIYFSTFNPPGRHLSYNR